MSTRKLTAATAIGQDGIQRRRTILEEQILRIFNLDQVPVKEHDRVYPRQGDNYGVATGNFHRCKLEGCTGARVSVKWPDGKITYPCTKGLK